MTLSWCATSVLRVWWGEHKTTSVKQLKQSSQVPENTLKMRNDAPDVATSSFPPGVLLVIGIQTCRLPFGFLVTVQRILAHFYLWRGQTVRCGSRDQTCRWCRCSPTRPSPPACCTATHRETEVTVWMRFTRFYFDFTLQTDLRKQCHLPSPHCRPQTGASAVASSAACWWTPCE